MLALSQSVVAEFDMAASDAWYDFVVCSVDCQSCWLRQVLCCRELTSNWTSSLETPRYLDVTEISPKRIKKLPSFILLEASRSVRLTPLDRLTVAWLSPSRKVDEFSLYLHSAEFMIVNPMFYPEKMKKPTAERGDSPSFFT